MDLNEDQQKVWDILSAPYQAPTVWDDVDLKKIVDEIKRSMIESMSTDKFNDEYLCKARTAEEWKWYRELR